MLLVDKARILCLIATLLVGCEGGITSGLLDVWYSKTMLRE